MHGGAIVKRFEMSGQRVGLARKHALAQQRIHADPYGERSRSVQNRRV